MSPVPIRDPNAPPDPSELREVPDHQMAPDSWVGVPGNMVPPGAPPSPDDPTGVPPVDPSAPPDGEQLPVGGPPGKPPGVGGGPPDGGPPGKPPEEPVEEPQQTKAPAKKK